MKSNIKFCIILETCTNNDCSVFNLLNTFQDARQMKVLLQGRSSCSLGCNNLFHGWHMNNSLSLLCLLIVSRGWFGSKLFWHKELSKFLRNENEIWKWETRGKCVFKINVEGVWWQSQSLLEVSWLT